MFKIIVFEDLPGSVNLKIAYFTDFSILILLILVIANHFFRILV